MKGYIILGLALLCWMVLYASLYFICMIGHVLLIQIFI